MKTYWQNIEQKRDVSISSEPRAAICSEYWGDELHGEREARAYIGGLGALPPVRSKGKKPLFGGLGGEASLKLTNFQHIGR